MKTMRFLCVLGVCLLLTSAFATAQTHSVTTSKVRYLGTTHIQSGPPPLKSPTPFLRKGPEVDMGFEIPGASGNNSPARVRAAHVPTVSGNAIVGGSFLGFVGLTEFEQAYEVYAGNNGLNGELEPPDQALAVGNGFVLEAINNAIAIYDTSGNFVGAEALNPFFQQAPEATYDPKTGAIVSFGPFLADPRILYDASTGNFFVSETEIDTDPATGNFGNAAHLLLAVSLDSNPLDGFNVFSIDVTNDGDARFGTCPCFGDQPLVGFDANGYYLSTNAFSLVAGNFMGEQLYAFSKAALEATPPSGSPTAVTAGQHFGNLNQAEGPGHSIQPSFIPPGGSFVSDNGGTEYLASTLDFTGTLDNRLTVWALTNTSSLNSVSPNLSIANVVIDTETYGRPPATQQKAGPTPLLDYLASVGYKNHEELINDNDDRLQQVTYANGMLWTSVPTVVQTPNGPVRAGAAWFILGASMSGGQLNAWVSNQGYVAINSPHQDSVLFPAVGVNAAGKAAIAFSIAGEDFYPSAGYSMLDASNGAGPIVISGPGVAPDDGFTAYRPVGPDFRVARWGDYSFAVADENGNIWMGGEMIPPEQAPFLTYANWGSFITQVTP
jgi:hypothetical protein